MRRRHGHPWGHHPPHEHGHHGHRPGRGRWRGLRGPLWYYLRGRLHRRIFASFGVSIAAMGALMFLGFWWLGKMENGGWGLEMERLRRFTGERFSQVWEQPEERAALARSMNRDLEVDVTVRDANGALLDQFGAPCGKHAFRVPVRRGMAPAGEIEVCAGNRSHPGMGRFFLLLFAAGSILWAASGRLARRLTRPLAELARVAEDLGQGKLKSRVELSDGQGEFNVLGQVLNEMASRIERQLGEQRELLAAVSHELRTPLTRVRILAELLRGENAQEKLVADLEREVVDMDRLVGELLANARLDFTAVDRRALDVAELARRALERAALPATALVLEGTGGFEVLGDPTLLSRALANLLDNAEKHGAGLSCLRVSASDHRVRMVAEDAGQGFSAGEEEKVFGAFVRGDSSRAKETLGLGLGLSLVRRIAEAHGGVAFAGNLQGGGAAVGFEIPGRAGIPG